MKISLVPDLQNLDEYAAMLHHAHDRLEELWSSLWAQQYMAKREIALTESQVWMRWSQKLVSGKSPTQKYVDNQVEMDPQVQAAHLKYAKITRKMHQIEGKLRTIRMVDRTLPGRQGERNHMLGR